MKKTTILILLTFFSSLIYGQETGLIFMDEDEYNSLETIESPMMGELPPKIDLSKFLPPPGDQGRLLSCVGWAVGYGLMSYLESKESGIPPTSQDNFYSPSFIYNQINKFGCAAGSNIKEAMELLKKKGCVTLQEFPYNGIECSSQPSLETIKKAAVHKIESFKKIDVQDVISVRGILNSGFPVVIGMNVDNRFQDLGQNEIYKGVASLSGSGHAMLVVGYDDSKNAFRVLNSWGPNWSSNGYGWVDYNSFRLNVKQAFIVEDKITNTQDLATDVTSDPETTNALSIEMNDIKILHNQFRPNPMGGPMLKGMTISVHGNIINGTGNFAQILIRFTSLNGNPLIANFNERIYRDPHGYVAAGTPKGPIVNNPVDLSRFTFFIPYYALNFIPTNSQVKYDFNVQASLYINDFEKEKSPIMRNFVFY